MNNKILTILALAVLVVGLAALGTAAVTLSSQAKPGEPHAISVTGEGKVNVDPDIAVANVGVESRSEDISRAVDDNNAKTAKVVDAIRTLGVKDADIHTSNFSVYWQDNYDPNTGLPTGEGRYIVNNTVTITVRDIPRLGEVLGDALAAGANSVGGVSFSVEDPSAAVAEARDKAVADARAKAEQIAGGLDTKIGRVLSINEYGATVPYAVEKGYGVGGGGGAVPVSPGTYEVSLTLSVTFELQ